MATPGVIGFYAREKKKRQRAEQKGLNERYAERERYNRQQQRINDDYIIRLTMAHIMEQGGTEYEANYGATLYPFHAHKAWGEVLIARQMGFKKNPGCISTEKNDYVEDVVQGVPITPQIGYGPQYDEDFRRGQEDAKKCMNAGCFALIFGSLFCCILLFFRLFIIPFFRFFSRRKKRKR